MKKRIRLCLTLSSLLFCVAIMGFCVFAVTTTSVSVSNNLQFIVPQQLYVQISASLKHGESQESTYANKNYKGETPAVEEISTDLPAWSGIPDILLTEESPTVTYNFTIINKSNYNISATFVPVESTFASFTYAAATADGSAATNNSVLILANDSGRLIISVTLADFTKAVNQNVQFSIRFDKQA